jgi:hypothetical protein
LRDGAVACVSSISLDFVGILRCAVRAVSRFILAKRPPTFHRLEFGALVRRNSGSMLEAISVPGSVDTRASFRIGRVREKGFFAKNDRGQTPARMGAENQPWTETLSQVGVCAARRIVTTGRCLRACWKHTSSSSRPPGCPLTSTWGKAQGADRGQKARGSKRGLRLAGRWRKYTSSGVLPPKVVCGRRALYQTANQANSCRNVWGRSDTTSFRAHSTFTVWMNRSATAMFPCWPIAPNRGRMSLLLRQTLNSQHQNCLPGSDQHARHG